MNEANTPAPTPFKRRHTNAQRAVLALNITVVIACLVGAGALVYAKSELDDTLVSDAVEVATTPPTLAPTTASPSTLEGSTTSAGPSTVPPTFPPADPAARNFLITGSDANACVDPNSPWANAADPQRDTVGNRTDTIMVLRLDPATRQAAVLSFPRDLWVKIPGRGRSRINSAGDQLEQTIYDNFGVVIDHKLQVDFCAFKLIVDAVGGVAVPFATPIKDANVGIDIPVAGCHVFYGDEALAYVRSRHLKWVDEDGTVREDRASDLGRISRQQDFLRRTLQAALEKGIYDPAVATALIESMQQYIVRDEGLSSLNAMLEFAGVLKDVDPRAISTYQIEAAGVVISGAAVLEPRIKGENMKAILAIFQGTAPLAGAPEQVFETTTVPGETPPATTVSGTDSGTTVPTTTVPSAATTTTVPGPEENVKGDIVPDENVTC
ncbi:MAG TPA: hypothetical protein DCR14_02210 [Acidimicrobiaceae bacterium]|nr:hypothetical protein [Acidimicrobiaceae bacterium]